MILAVTFFILISIFIIITLLCADTYGSDAAYIPCILIIFWVLNTVFITQALPSMANDYFKSNISEFEKHIQRDQAQLEYFKNLNKAKQDKEKN